VVILGGAVLWVRKSPSVWDPDQGWDGVRRVILVAPNPLIWANSATPGPVSGGNTLGPVLRSGLGRQPLYPWRLDAGAGSPAGRTLMHSFACLLAVSGEAVGIWRRWDWLWIALLGLFCTAWRMACLVASLKRLKAPRSPRCSLSLEAGLRNPFSPGKPVC